MLEGVSRRNELFNALLDTVKEHSSGLEIGSVRAVLSEVDGEIATRMGRQQFDDLKGKLKKREPRE